MKIFLLAAAAVVALFAGHASPAKAQIAGEWTKCVAWNNGTTYNIVNGFPNQNRCFQLARVCTGNQNVVATYYSSAVVVNAPYVRCTAN
jgi:hypothetical protein